ncbi:MAG: hypothetical protein U5R48_16470 [Gammaproteobacteria bacterium]|nr:hypothetical protein [Gammaproteobacteria bacterium]
MVAGVSSGALDANGVPVIEGYGLGSALGALDADGNPLLAGSLDGPSDFAPGVETTDRATLLSAADVFLTASSGSIIGPSQPANGAAGVTWGRFAQPTRLFLDASDPTRFVETSGLPEIPFLIGTPTDIADLTGQRFYELVDADVAIGPDHVFLEMFSDALLDLGTGELDGVLDVALAESATPETMRFIYVVDYNARVRGGLLQDTNITLASLFDQSTGEERTADAELSGFVSGTDGEYLNLGFAYSTPDDPGLNTAGVALLQSGLTPANALTAEELIAIDEGFAFVAVECCFEGDTAEGLISDPRPSNGLDAVAALNRDGDLVPASPLDPAFVEFPPNTVVRRQDAGVVNFATLDLGAGGELATFEWQGVDGTPVGLFDSATGDPTGEVTGNLLVLTGRMADLADLTGTGRFELVDLSQGFFLSESGAVEAQPLAGGNLSFNVDFATGGVFGGVARLYTDTEDDTAPSFARDGFEALFEGQVALANDNPFVDFVITDGRYFDADEDTSGNGLINLTESDLSGFFAGDGSVFNMSLNLTSAPPDPNTPHDPINAVALAILQQQDLSLSAAELTQLEQGRVFAAAACCSFDTAGTAIGPAGDPGNLGEGDVLATEGDFVLGINIGGTGEDLGPLDAGAAASPEDILRKGGASGLVFRRFPGAAGSRAGGRLLARTRRQRGADRGSGNGGDPRRAGRLHRLHHRLPQRHRHPAGRRLHHLRRCHRRDARRHPHPGDRGLQQPRPGTGPVPAGNHLRRRLLVQRGSRQRRADQRPSVRPHRLPRGAGRRGVLPRPDRLRQRQSVRRDRADRRRVQPEHPDRPGSQQHRAVLRRRRSPERQRLHRPGQLRPGQRGDQRLRESRPRGDGRDPVGGQHGAAGGPSDSDRRAGAGEPRPGPDPARPGDVLAAGQFRPADRCRGAVAGPGRRCGRCSATGHPGFLPGRECALCPG